MVIEGPAFGTRAESELYRSWGASVVGMTALPEAKLAREAELCYAVLAAVTDYDAWHEDHDAVDAATVFAVLQRNVEASREVVRQLVRSLPLGGSCACRDDARCGAGDATGAIDEAARTGCADSGTTAGGLAMTLLVAGWVAIDEIETPFAKVKNSLGGSATCAALAGALFTDVRLLAAVGDDFPASTARAWSAKHIDLAGLTHRAG